MHLRFHRVRIYPAAVTMTSLLMSVVPLTSNAQQAQYEQEFVITAYYSPLPDQCCYIEGDYIAEKIMNGQGIAGADGTGVYPGMIAAPKSYEFGTRIELPGIGIGTVHDRGGAIIESADGTHRLDLWMGYGEEGLARALAWGVQRVRGTVYPLGTSQPVESFALNDFEAPRSILSVAPNTGKDFLVAQSKLGDDSSSVILLQESLKSLGYFNHAVTTTFGSVTQEALAAFQRDVGIIGDGAVADDATRAAILAAGTLTEEFLPALGVHLSEGMNGAEIRQAQKLLRFIGAYDGRTDGVFDGEMAAQVLAFQMKQGIVSGAGTAGAGRIGPKTRGVILDQWKKKELTRRQEIFLDKIVVAQAIDSLLPERTLTRGKTGEDVRSVQRLLADLGFFPSQSVNGIFGPQTEEALKSYQIDRGIIASDKSHGAGVMGPATRISLSKDAMEVAWSRVREQGIEAL